MIELILAIILIVTMARVAVADNQSGALWGCACLVITFLCFAIPIPFARVLIAGILTWVAMITYKIAFNK